MTLPRILINEDSPVDLRMLLDELQRAHLSCETRCTSTRAEFIGTIKDFAPDIVISGYYLTDFDGLHAIDIVRDISPGTPVVILTSTLNDETAVECMKRGASDYVLKNRMPRIVPCVTSLLERKRAAQERARLEHEHELLFQLTPNLFCIADYDGRLVEVNPAWRTRLGLAREKLVGQTFRQLICREDHLAFDHWWEMILLAARNPASTKVPGDRCGECECRMAHLQGEIRHFVWNATPLPAENRIYAYGHDVTERLRAEAALLESEERFRSMADSAPVLMWVTDERQKIIYCNRPWLEFTGRSTTEEYGEGWLAGIHPDDQSRFHENFEASFQDRQPFRMIFRLRRHDGAYRWILDYGTPRFDDHDSFLGFIGSCIDITEQHEAENALTQRAVKQTALVDFSSFALARHPFSTLLAAAVRTVADTLGIEFSQVLERTDDSGRLLLAASAEMGEENPGSPVCSCHPNMFDGRVLLWPDDGEVFPDSAALTRRGVRSGIAVVIGNGEKPYGLLTALTCQQRDFSGDSATFLQSIANILSTVQARLLAETALAESEQKLLQSQKMEAVGLLAGGVAHDFNNLLTAIRCYGEFLSDDLQEQAPAAQPKVSEILKATARASALTRQLLAFSRKQVVQPETLDLNVVITDLTDILRSLLSENIMFDLQLSQDPLGIYADRGQIEQVLINLAINARDAMPQGGRITLRTSRRSYAAKDEEGTDLAPNHYVELAVSDTGVGMSSEIQARLFEPFFTTKPKGRGTGLGLATCSVILKNAGGTIRCVSRLGQGTTFTVLLPEAHDSGLTTVTQEDDTPLGRYESILLVEDDEAVRNVTESILRSLGYEVRAEPGGAEALALCLSENAPHFDLLLTDIVMPYIGGHELAQRLTSLRPTLKVVFMSGYVDDPIILQSVQEAQIPFLEKPFNRTTLAKRIREALEAKN